MEWYRIQMKIQDLCYVRPWYGMIFKEFEIWSGSAYIYHGVRFKWMVKGVCFLTGCKHRFWQDTKADLKRG